MEPLSRRRPIAWLLICTHTLVAVVASLHVRHWTLGTDDQGRATVVEMCTAVGVISVRLEDDGTALPSGPQQDPSAPLEMPCLGAPGSLALSLPEPGGALVPASVVALGPALYPPRLAAPAPRLAGVQALPRGPPRLA